MSLPDAFYESVAAMGARNGMRGEHLLRVWWSESGLNPHQLNRKDGDARGLNQFRRGTLKGMGLTDAEIEDYPNWGWDRQLPLIERALRSLIKYIGAPFQAPEVYHAANFRPLYLKRAGRQTPDVVMMAREDVDPKTWEADKGLDYDGDGKITIGDLAIGMDRIAKKPGYVAHRKRIEQYEPPVPSPATKDTSPERASAAVWPWVIGAGAVVGVGVLVVRRKAA